MIFKIFLIFLLTNIIESKMAFSSQKSIKNYFKPIAPSLSNITSSPIPAALVNEDVQSKSSNLTSRKRLHSSENVNEQPKEKRSRRTIASYTVSLLKEYNSNYDFYIDKDKRPYIVNVGDHGYIAEHIPFILDEGSSESEETTNEGTTVTKKKNHSIILKEKIGDTVKYAEYKVRGIPKWHPYFKGMDQHFSSSGGITIDHPNLELTSGLIFTCIPADNRVFVSIFGNGRHLIDSGEEDSQFGLITALNVVNPEQIKKIAKFHRGPRALYRIEHYIKSIKAGDVSRDGFLRNISGKSVADFLEPGNFSISTNGTSLKLSRDFSFDSFNQDCLDLYEYYKKEPPKEFEWIQYILPIKNKKDITRLDKRLTQDILNEIINHQEYSIPLLREGIEFFESVEFFKWGQSKKKYGSFDEMFSIKSRGLEIEELRSIKINCFNNSGDKISHFKAADCLIYEFEDNHGDLKVFFEGMWYAIQNEFRKSLNKEIDALRVSFSDLEATVASDFTPFQYTDKQGKLKQKIKLEENYIKRIVKNNPGNLYLMDQRDVGGNSGRGTVEVCDILSNSNNTTGYKRLIHIKDWTKSAPFSHLCFQSLISAEALILDDFRKRAKKTLVRYEVKDQLTPELERVFDDKNEPLIKSFMSDLDDRMKEINSNHEMSTAISGYLEEKKIVPLCERKTNEYLDTIDNLLLINQRFEPNQYMVVLALVHKDSEKTISSCLPFFSRLSLRDTARSLQELRYNVGFNFIKKQNSVQSTNAILASRGYF